MTRTWIWLSAGALALVVGAGVSASAEEQGKHRERVQRAARGGEPEARRAVPRGNDDGNRGSQRAPAVRQNEQRVERQNRSGNSDRNRNWNSGRDHNDHNWEGKRRGPVYVTPGYVYRSPRVIVPSRYPHRYGNGGNFSAFFGLGSGYRYGSPYYGRVYGYSAPVYAGPRRYYGDLRLQVRPRDAAVYVDGYYAGVVDDFDGVFQRLTVEVGPHEIEVERPGFAPQLFNVYVDPTRTIDLRADLYPER